MTRSLDRIVLAAYRLLIIMSLLVASASGSQSAEAQIRPAARVSQHPEWNERSRWRLEATPSISIHGGSERTAQLSDVRFAARLSNGLLVVADRRTQAVQFLRADGTIVAAVGGDGGTPRADAPLGNMFRCGGDALWMFRGQGGLLLSISATGQPGREIRLTVGGAAGAFNPLACGPGGLVAVSGPGDDPAPPARGSYRVSHRVAVFAMPSGQRTADLGSLPVADLDALPSAAFNRNQLFGRNRMQAVGSEHVVYGMGDAWEVQVVGLDGRGLVTWQINRPVRAVTPADTSRLRRLIVDGATPAMRPAYLAALESATLPRTMPAYSAIRIDPDGNVWLREYDYRNMILNVGLPIPYASVVPPAVTWVVLSRTGQWLGEVEVPPTFRVFEIGSDYLLGMQTGPDRVERLQMYRLLKP